MLRLTRRADAPVRRTASVTHWGAAGCSEPRLQRPGWFVPVSHRIDSRRRYVHKSAHGPPPLERPLSINPLQRVLKPLKTRAYTTQADGKNEPTPEEKLQEAKDLQQLEGTFESPPVVDNEFPSQKDVRDWDEARQHQPEQANAGARKETSPDPRTETNVPHKPLWASEQKQSAASNHKKYPKGKWKRRKGPRREKPAEISSFPFSSEEGTSELNASEPLVSEQKTSEQKTSEQKTSEQKTSEQKTSEQKTSEQKTSEQKTSEQKIPKAKTSDVKTPEAKTSDVKTPETKASEAKTSKKSTSKKNPPNTAKKPIKRTLHTHHIRMKPLAGGEPLDVPKLSYNLDRVLFNPGVFQLQDDRSRVFNFDPYLASIMPIEEFDFDALSAYITSSKDAKLRQMTAKAGLKYCGSTSSLTSFLSHLHYLLSAWRKPSFRNLSRGFSPNSEDFTILMRAPTAAFLHYENGVYAMDADKGFDSSNVLSLLGQSMEKLLTVPKEEFETYRKSRGQKTGKQPDPARDAFHYTQVGDIMIRSQLDAHDHRLPGNGVFDVKTRAVVTVRMDVDGYEKGTGYEIRSRFGQWESYEREYFDMIRAAFLKYSLQVRLGRMDGIFVAYHNTQRIFGFQYVSLQEMDEAIHGTGNTQLGDHELKASLRILNDLLDMATKRFPGQTLRLHIEATKGSSGNRDPGLLFIAQPVTEEEMKKIQESKKPDFERIKRSVRKMADKEASIASASEVENPPTPGKQDQKESESRGVSHSDVDVTQNDTAWEEMTTQLEKVIADDYFGVRCVRKALKDVLEARNLLQNVPDIDIARHLDSLTEALSLHLYETNRTKDADQKDAEEGENETAPKVAADAEIDASPSEPMAEVVADEEIESSSSEPKAIPNPSETDEIAGAETSAAFEAGVLRDLLLRVTDGISAETQSSRGFKRVFASVIAEMQDQSQDEQLVEEDPIESKTAQNNDSTPQSFAPAPEDQILGVYVKAVNKVDGEVVARPAHYFRKWEIQYTLSELSPEEAMSKLSLLKLRRTRIFDKDPEQRADSWRKAWGGRLSDLSRQGEQFRKARTKDEQGKKISVAWSPMMQEWKDFLEVPEASSRMSGDVDGSGGHERNH